MPPVSGCPADLSGSAWVWAEGADGAATDVPATTNTAVAVDADGCCRGVARGVVRDEVPTGIARVVINGRTGTVVMGEQVRIAPVAVAHGALIVEVSETPAVSQPAPLAGGTTTPVPASAVAAQEPAEALKVVAPGATLAAVVGALNALGATPRDLIEILQAIHAAGALQAELEVL